MHDDLRLPASITGYLMRPNSTYAHLQEHQEHACAVLKAGGAAAGQGCTAQ